MAGRSRRWIKRGLLAAFPTLRRAIDEREYLRGERARLRGALARERKRADSLELQVAQAPSSTAPRVGLGYVFIVTYGRSGSTLLQGILNSIPGYLVRGENNGAVHRLFRYQQSVAGAKAKHSRAARLPVSHPWFGIDEYPIRRALALQRDLLVRTILRPEADTRVAGFKEIRWFQSDCDAYITYMQQVFPDARFVINTRNHADVIRSKWWADKDDPADLVRAYESRLEAIGSSLGDRAYHVRYDDYVADPDVLEGMFSWLGETYERAKVQAVLDTKHSY